MPCVYYNDGSFTYHKHHETRGVFYKHICSTCFAHEGKSSAHSAVECRQKNIKKTNKPGHGLWLHGLLLTASSSHAYTSRIVNCRDKDIMSQYDTPSHVWKHWLTMSNMCRPVDSRLRYLLLRY